MIVGKMERKTTRKNRSIFQFVVRLSLLKHDTMLANRMFYRVNPKLLLNLNSPKERSDPRQMRQQ
jgi:hypothetical protein